MSVLADGPAGVLLAALGAVRQEPFGSEMTFEKVRQGRDCFFSGGTQ